MSNLQEFPLRPGNMFSDGSFTQSEVSERSGPLIEQLLTHFRSSYQVDDVTRGLLPSFDGRGYEWQSGRFAHSSGDYVDVRYEPQERVLTIALDRKQIRLECNVLSDPPTITYTDCETGYSETNTSAGLLFAQGLLHSMVVTPL